MVQSDKFKKIISPNIFFSVFQNFDFQNDKKILSVALHFSETIHHMIAIYGTHL